MLPPTVNAAAATAADRHDAKSFFILALPSPAFALR
jgi:hypothetical protein